MEVIKGFIVIEGLDGSGTTTQLEKIKSESLKTANDIHTTFEPTNGPIGKIIRKILRNELSVNPKTLALLFAADRREHLFEPANGIIDRCGRGEVVVSDRYLFSSLAYQSLECGYPFVLQLNNEFPLPEHCIYLDISPEICETRLKSRGVQELFDALKTQERIRELYEHSFKEFPKGKMSFHRLDGEESMEEVFKKIWRIVQSVPMNKK